MNRPSSKEYNPYFKPYIDIVPAGEIMQLLEENKEATAAFFRAIDASKADYAYASGKWTIKEILAHLIDSERAFAYRALVCLRCDASVSLPNMDQDHYLKYFNIKHKSLDDLIESFQLVRASSIQLFKDSSNANATFLAQTPTGGISAQALAYIMVGHTLHHKQVIRDKYLG